MFCRECGVELPEEAEFCTKCGKPIKKKAETEPVSAVRTEDKKMPGAADLIPVEEINAPKKNPRGVLFAVLVVLLVGGIGFAIVRLSGICLIHSWQPATCEAPSTCEKCGAVRGEALGHDWQPAACETPETCAVCGAVRGEAPGHNWQEPERCMDATVCLVCGAIGDIKGHDWKPATCTEPETCAVCGAVQGEPAGHDWQPATCTAPETCRVCGEMQGWQLDHELDGSGKCIYCRAQIGTPLSVSNFRDYFTVIFCWTNDYAGNRCLEYGIEPLEYGYYGNVVITYYITDEDGYETDHYSFSLDSEGYGSHITYPFDNQRKTAHVADVTGYVELY